MKCPKVSMLACKGKLHTQGSDELKSEHTGTTHGMVASMATVHRLSLMNGARYLRVQSRA